MTFPLSCPFSLWCEILAFLLAAFKVTSNLNHTKQGRRAEKNVCITRKKTMCTRNCVLLLMLPANRRYKHKYAPVTTRGGTVALTVNITVGGIEA